MINNAVERNSLRNENKKTILNNLSKNPTSMIGVITSHINKAEVVELENPDANTINTSHPLAKDILANNPMPSADKVISFKSVKTKDGLTPTENELELARQLSEIMILDMLNGQWDRWSGGNVEASWDKDTNKLKLIARDNGGSSMSGSGVTKKYLSVVSRFDRAQIERVKYLSEQLSKDSASVADILQMKSNTNSLKVRVQIILDHVKQQETTFGDNAYFP